MFCPPPAPTQWISTSTYRGDGSSEALLSSIDLSRLRNVIAGLGHTAIAFTCTVVVGCINNNSVWRFAYLLICSSSSAGCRARIPTQLVCKSKVVLGVYSCSLPPTTALPHY